MLVNLVNIKCKVMKCRLFDEKDPSKGYILVCTQDYENFFNITSSVEFKKYAETQKEEDLVCTFRSGLRKSDNQPYAFFQLVC